MGGSCKVVPFFYENIFLGFLLMKRAWNFNLMILSIKNARSETSKQERTETHISMRKPTIIKDPLFSSEMASP